MAFSEKPIWTIDVEDGLFGTLTYKNHVYPVADVNYILWGFVNGLANRDNIYNIKTTLDNTTFLVTSYRMLIGGYIALSSYINSPRMEYYMPLYESIPGKRAWATYGWKLAQFTFDNLSDSYSHIIINASSLFSAKPNNITIGSRGVQLSGHFGNIFF